MVKDYYKILEIEPTANAAELKAAYRKLALQFHPDKNPGDKYALSQFYLVKEAYETLSSQSLKDEYLKERWLSKANNEKLGTEANTPENILHRFLNANKKMQQFDAFRMDKKGIASEIHSLLNSNNIAILNEFNEQQINQEIINQAIQMVSSLHPSQTEKIFVALKKINGGEASVKSISEAEKEIKQQATFNRLTPWLIALAVIFLCILIFVASKN